MRKIFGIVLLLFSLMVSYVPAQVEAGQVSYAWDAPTSDMAGNVLPTTGTGSITGYKFYCGTSSGTWTKTQVVPPTPLTATITGLTSGTLYYCMITASNSAGESGPSNIVSKTAITIYEVPVGCNTLR